ncbi:MAG: phosphotransferase enzyme family protein [Phycisphaerales bacterium]
MSTPSSSQPPSRGEPAPGRSTQRGSPASSIRNSPAARDAELIGTPPRRLPAAATITAGEIALVCARYDIGEITRVQRLKRGSGSSPKVILQTSTGEYILKRLAPTRADPRRVAFSHELQLFLISRGFPAPPLIGTRDGNNSMLQTRGNTYELHRYIRGREDSRLPDDARTAGAALSVLHRTLQEFGLHTDAGWTPPASSYHNSDHVPRALARIPRRFDDPDRREVALNLIDLYRRSAVEAGATEPEWKPAPFIHGDWHPGNMLFLSRANRRAPATAEAGDGAAVACVLDFDSARPGQRIIDVANGALQFALARPAEDATSGSLRTAPATRSKQKQAVSELSYERYRAFIDGYHFNVGTALSAGERRAIPWLMIQALIAEAAIPIAITGRFGKVDPMGVLRLVRRKAGWIEQHAGEFHIGG